jgi:hypothetical protein
MAESAFDQAWPKIVTDNNLSHLNDRAQAVIKEAARAAFISGFTAGARWQSLQAQPPKHESDFIKDIFPGW